MKRRPRIDLGRLAFLTLLVLGLCPGRSAAAEKKPAPASSPSVGPGMQVAVEYTMSDEKGEVIESNKGQSPFIFISGAGEGKETVMIPSLEAALMGLHVGDQKEVKLLPDDAYGPVLKEAFKEVPKGEIPPAARKVGAVLQAQSTDGRTVPVRVSQVTDDIVQIDFNHPLAGKTLVFNVKVIAVKKVEGAGAVPPVESGPLPVEIPR